MEKEPPAVNGSNFKIISQGKRKAEVVIRAGGQSYTRHYHLSGRDWIPNNPIPGSIALLDEAIGQRLKREAETKLRRSA